MAKNVTQAELRRVLWSVSAVLTLILLAGGFLSMWGNNFATNQVRDQLVQEKIKFPDAGSPALDPEKYPGLQRYAGQAVDSGPKAKAYANEYIWVHMMDASGGKTYAEASSAARANPDDKKLAAVKETLFQGSALRSSLLTAYAFSVFGMVAGYAMVAMFAGAAIMALLTIKFLAKKA